MGTLYYGDTLDVLYLDPPLNSAQNYNAFFHGKDGTDAASQIRACEDTRSWNQEAPRAKARCLTIPRGSTTPRA